MSSPTKPSKKQTLLPDFDIKGLIVKDSPSQRSFDNLIQDGADATTSDFRYLDQSSPHYQPLNRLPTLYEILNRRTQSPVDLWSFYVYIRDYQHAVDYLDFWIDVVTHLRLCKDYVKGLRESLLLSEKHKSTSDEKYKTFSDENNQVGKSTNEARESVSSSLLLEALLNEGFLDDKDNKRVSSFLQGQEYINTANPRISAIFNSSPFTQEVYDDDNLEGEHEGLQQQQYHEREGQEKEEPLYEAPRSPRVQRYKDPYEPLSSPKKVFAADIHRRSSSMHDILSHTQYLSNRGEENPRNSTRITPELLEKYTANVKNGNITRTTLKSSSKNLLNTYFQENSPKKLQIPDRIIRKIRHDVELQGRDDPDVFEDAKNYVYSIMERETLPFFLQANALHNIGNHSSIVRLIVGFVFLFIGFWISYVLIFIDIKPKAIRAVLIVPFFIGSYMLMSFLFRLDPLFVFLGISDNIELSSNYAFNNHKNAAKHKKWLRNLKEPFVVQLLRRRGLWVLFLGLVLTAVLSLIFGLVPGHRI